MYLPCLFFQYGWFAVVRLENLCTLCVLLREKGRRRTRMLPFRREVCSVPKWFTLDTRSRGRLSGWDLRLSGANIAEETNKNKRASVVDQSWWCAACGGQYHWKDPRRGLVKQYSAKTQRGECVSGPRATSGCAIISCVQFACWREQLGGHDFPRFAGAEQDENHG